MENNKTVIRSHSHRVFKRTFLNEIRAEFHYPEIDFNNKINEIKEFMSSAFSQDVNYTPNENIDSIRIKAADESLDFIFRRNYAKIKIKPEIYVSYPDTFKPCIDVVKRFVSSMGIATLEEILISKTNLWRASVENAYEVWRDALLSTFDDVNIRMISEVKLPEEKSLPLQLTRQAISECMETSVTMDFKVTIPNDNEFMFGLVINGLQNSVSTESIFECTEEINKNISDAFQTVVSDKILDLMMEE